jgi:hypothetical protein
MITKKDYENLKEYWDYQRKVEYNKEVVFNMADSFEGRVYNDFGPVNLNDMKELLWARVKSEDYENPRKGWVPLNENYRFEWEGEANMPDFEIPPPKGDSIAMRAKDLKEWQEALNDEDNT